jgi:hypothetical protein
MAFRLPHGLWPWHAMDKGTLCDLCVGYLGYWTPTLSYSRWRAVCHSPLRRCVYHMAEYEVKDVEYSRWSIDSHYDHGMSSSQAPTSLPTTIATGAGALQNSSLFLLSTEHPVLFNHSWTAEFTQSTLFDSSVYHCFWFDDFDTG